MSVLRGVEAKQWIEALRWLARAEEDIRIVELVVAQPSFPIAPTAVLCQQAAEKMAKAVLIALGVVPPRIHDVGKLANLVRTHLPAMGESIAELEEMTAWYISNRYPDRMDDGPSQEQIQAALTKLRSLRARIDTLAPKA